MVSFESRRASELGEMLARRGATVISAPAMRELPIGHNPAPRELFSRLSRGEIDVLILLTGVGTRALVEAVKDHYGEREIVALLKGVPLVARGPKPVAALRTLGLTATVLVPEPNTWRDLLEALDRELPVGGLRVAVQEYGLPNPELYAGLRQRGADVMPVPVYRWALPEDLGPLRLGIATLIAGQADVAVFTSARQVDHVLDVAGESPSGEASLLVSLREQIVVAAVGPIVSAALAARALPVDLVPDHPKLGPLVALLAEQGPRLVAEKRSRR